jgi:hypothetical protein
MKKKIVFTCGRMIPFQLHRPSRFYLAIELYERILQTKLGNRPCPIGYLFHLGRQQTGLFLVIHSPVADLVCNRNCTKKINPCTFHQT